ncbi:efflux transporter, RND family, MFP subunit [Burkholderia ambifaria IOP40-10]|uniref:Efflux transporter, RND family, MFP subunit n=1 Tax=Burkholderia ambifaria IOP40-10 TaxID=396596 RepID=B1FE88_9BURK|nr:efflux RND transporter periplasmic adaptor subunit [Burkholderia ambifaria]EDT04115.1 efflux transporter, RND family, MFP subunit [Burkholderia ambifaria IOP40-10]
MSNEFTIQSPKRLRHLRTVGVIATLLATGIATIGIAERIHAKQLTARWSAEQAIPTVSAQPPSLGATDQALVLPGHLAAFVNAPIHARVSGYLRSWYADIGTPVKAGELLGLIDTPELDAQLSQARADLAVARADEVLAATTAARWSRMLQQDSVSRQDADEKTSDLAAKRAIVAARSANVRRLEALESFKRVVAPFDGVVTARKTDVGALISAGDNAGPALFAVSDVRRLRVYVSVPQSEAATIKPGMTATLSVPEHPGMRFSARLVDTDESIASASGTLLTQFTVDNHDGLLMPGEFAEVHLTSPSAPHTLQIPASALIFRHDGLQVAVVDAHHRAVLKPVQIATDFGNRVSIASGLAATDCVIDNPPDSLSSGDPVRLAAPTTRLSASNGEPVHG